MSDASDKVDVIVRLSMRDYQQLTNDLDRYYESLARRKKEYVATTGTQPRKGRGRPAKERPRMDPKYYVPADKDISILLQ